MRKAFIMQAAAALMLTASHNTLAAEEKAQPMNAVGPVVAEDHAALLASDDPQLAANKRLVYDMYRIVLQAGLAGRAHEFVTENYVQHNPNAAQGLDGLIEYVRSTRPEREIKDKLELPLIQLIAEGNYVMTSFVRPEKDAKGETYYSTWFDLYRIENGKVAEHWDPMLKSDPRIDPNDKKL